jgi:hypothetical protein
MVHRHRLLTSALGVAALMLAQALMAAGGHQSLAVGRIIFVDADAKSGARDGTSWDDAFIDLQPALELAVAGQQIWVAEGTYLPTWESVPGNPRSATFQMVNGVAIYGGFDPSVGATKLKDRDWASHVTILSGDPGTPGIRIDDSYHVLYHPAGTDLDGSAILDGVTITGGAADVYNGSPHGYGAGMYNDSSSPTVSNCTFLDNMAVYGGGMFNTNGASPALVNCTFTANSALDTGGGMANDASAAPTLTGCTFEDNSAGSGGGAIHNWAASPRLDGCSFTGNTAGDLGGGMYNANSALPLLTDCTFASNSAGWGGGGMFNNDASPVLANCTFSGNTAVVGGGMQNLSFCSTVLTNCTFSGNSADDGGAMSNGWYSSPLLTNCILWGDSPGEIHNADEGSSPVITYSDIQGGYRGTGNINAAPLFADAANGDYHLEQGSPCIDAGDNGAPYLPELDFEGNARIMDGDLNGTAIVDMGVDEYWLFAIVVEIKITPDLAHNVIRLRSAAPVPVAILSIPLFDAAMVDAATVRFAGAPAQGGTVEDVDGDGDADLLLTFYPADMVELDEDSKSATLVGVTYDGRPIQGTDRVKVIP